VIVAALNFLLFLAIIWRFGFDPIANILAQRKARIDQGLADAEQARKDRDAGVGRARPGRRRGSPRGQRLIATAQKSAQELRDADIAATREELARLHERATADLQAERDRAMADLRAQVADLALAAAGKLVGETMTAARQRRLVEEYLHERAETGEGRNN